MAQLAGRYGDISRIFEELLSGTRLEATRKRTITIAKAQLKQASEYGQRLLGRTKCVTSIAWSPDGSSVATASSDKIGAIWDAATGERQRVLHGHTEGLKFLAWSPDGSRVATASSDKTGAI
jgi:WD40 repeat protein